MGDGKPGMSRDVKEGYRDGSEMESQGGSEGSRVGRVKARGGGEESKDGRWKARVGREGDGMREGQEGCESGKGWES